MKKSLTQLLAQRKRALSHSNESQEPQATEVTEGDAEAVTSMFGPEGDEGTEATSSLAFEMFALHRTADTAKVLLNLRQKLAKGAKRFSLESIDEVEVQQAIDATVPDADSVVDSAGAPEGAAMSENAPVATSAPIETAAVADDAADELTGDGELAAAAVDAGAEAGDAVDVAEELSQDELDTVDMVSSALTTGEGEGEGVLPSVEHLKGVSRKRMLGIIDSTVNAAMESLIEAAGSKRESVAKAAVTHRVAVQKRIAAIAKQGQR